ncbi:MAG: helix-turn-helix transcriptional regulator [Acetobacterium sp.]
MDGKKIGKTLAKLRGDKSPYLVAEELGLSIAAIRQYEYGNRIPKDNNKVLIADYYKKTVQEIFFDEQASDNTKV